MHGDKLPRFLSRRSGGLAGGSEEVCDGGPLKENDGFAVDDPAVGCHGKCFIEGNLENLDVFSLLLQAAPWACLIVSVVRPRRRSGHAR